MITATNFVKEYLKQGCDLQRTADELGTNATYVRTKVTYYRKRGVKLPLPKGSSKKMLNVAALNELIKSYK